MIRAALAAGEDGLVELPGELGVAAEDQATAGAAQGLVGGGGHHIAKGHRVGVQASGHQPGDVGHVGQQVSAHLIGDGAEGREINRAGVGGIAAHDQLGPVLQGQLADRVEIELVGRLIDAVVHGLEPLAAHVHRRAVGEVAAVAQIHAQDRVSGLEQGQEDGEVGLGAAVGLHVGPGGTKQLLGPANRQLLDGVDVLTAAVVALGRQPLGIFVGEHRALGLHHGPGGEVFGGDQLQVGLLTIQLLADQCRDGGVPGGERLVEGSTAGEGHGWISILVPIVRNVFQCGEWVANRAQKNRPRAVGGKNAPGEIRTPDPLIRSQML